MQSEEAPRKERPLLLSMLCSVLFAFTLAVYAPMETYFATASELWFGVDALWLGMLLAFIAALGISLGVCALLRGKARLIVNGLLFGLSLGLYVQATFLNKDFGVLNGAAIDWSVYGSYGLWNALIWLALAALPVVLLLTRTESTRSALRVLCVVLMLAQVFGLVAVVAQAPAKQEESAYAFSKQDEFTVSDTRNTIVFVLDTFDTTSFGELIDDMPDVAARLDGFTWFRNSVGGYPVTHYAMPYLLTGKPYLFEKSYGVYVAESWQADAFFGALKQAGYTARVYSETDYANANAVNLIDNIVSAPIVPSSSTALWGCMAKLVGLRYLPHALKPGFVLDTAAFNDLKSMRGTDVYLLNDETFIADYRANGLATQSQPGFALYHLRGAHPSYTLKSDGTLTSEGEFVNQHEQLAAVMSTIGDYCDALKQMGLYDGATIVVTADHGYFQLDPSPVLLIKRPNAAGAMQVNDALVSQRDLHQTLLNAAGLDVSVGYGQDMFTQTVENSGVVSYYDFQWVESDRVHGYDVSLDDQTRLSYESTNLQYSTEGLVERSVGTLALGERIEFSKPWKVLRYCDDIVRCYVHQADAGCWFGKPDVHFRFDLTDEEFGDLTVTFDVAEVKDGEQPLTVLCNGEVIAETTIHEGDATASFVVPYDACWDGCVSFTPR